MRGNPNDWRIEEVIAVCAAHDIGCTPPRNGSHYKVKHPSRTEILTIPARRPIKAVYIRALVRFVDQVNGE
ncbi:type II toxin-antitoxin system HicA family toxin [Sphingomonas sp. S1-29]|uniref:type II toxin-antitoxin system HicA family toxin n=1 Tax=Sphingomonas sp. S1-29 TaxID=2991074 RepID=UPI002240062E|nr:type II toxin-antitoxin system HicA family toxin [Sphingomonas sp. S1-29]UZK68987.1 type II toxin-antitoxin system HicA family toxin [Sphingomonas sp. S1-29]